MSLTDRDILYKERKLKIKEKEYNYFKEHFQKKLEQKKEEYYLNIEKKYDFVEEKIDSIFSDINKMEFVL
jgi:C-terminal processing protease CtpA/Prc